jgi:hypothetical protein
MGNAIFFGILAVVGIGFIIGVVWRQMHVELPSPAFLPHRPTKTSRIVTLILNSVLLGLFLANGYALAEPWTRSPPIGSDTAVAVAVILVVLMFIVTSLLSTLTLPRSLEWLERLERDIVIHDIGAKEIEERIETEYLGREIGAWLQHHLRLVRERAAAVHNFANAATSQLSDIRVLDPELRYEKLGRLEALSTEGRSLSDALYAAWNPLSDWLSRANQNILLEVELKDLLKRTQLELHKETLAALDAAKGVNQGISTAVGDVRRLTEAAKRALEGGAP